MCVEYKAQSVSDGITLLRALPPVDLLAMWRRRLRTGAISSLGHSGAVADVNRDAGNAFSGSSEFPLAYRAMSVRLCSDFVGCEFVAAVEFIEPEEFMDEMLFVDVRAGLGTTECG